MNCVRCHHIQEAHVPSPQSASFLKLGKCQIPSCTCQQYLDAIKETLEDIRDELLGIIDILKPALECLAKLAEQDRAARDAGDPQAGAPDQGACP